MASSIAKRCRQLSGDNNWGDLLDPLDIDLRRYLIHYGEMAQATYDAFNTEKASKYSNPYGYQVTKSLYATSQIRVPEAFIVKMLSREAWSKELNWIGYVAVAMVEGRDVLGRRDVVIAWRGTVENLEWIDDVEFDLVSPEKIFGVPCDAKVHDGWYSIYTSGDPRSLYDFKLNKIASKNQY